MAVFVRASPFNRVQLSVTLWTVAHQVPPFMGFSVQEYWSGSPGPPPGDRSNPRTDPTSLMSPALAGRFLTTSTTWRALPMATVTNHYKLSALKQHELTILQFWR